FPVPRVARAASVGPAPTVHVRRSVQSEVLLRGGPRLRAAGAVGGGPEGGSTGNRGVGVPHGHGPLHAASTGALRFRWTDGLPRDEDRVHRRAGVRALPDLGRRPRGVGGPPPIRGGPRHPPDRPRGSRHPAPRERIPPVRSGFRWPSDAARSEFRLAREMGSAVPRTRGPRTAAGARGLSEARRDPYGRSG